MTNPNSAAHAAASSSSSLKGITVATTRTTSLTTASRLGQASASAAAAAATESCSFSTSPLQKQRLSQSMRTQEEQENDMDIISALEIADVKAAPYDFFSSSSANNSSSSNNNNNNNNGSSSSYSSNKNSSNATDISSRRHLPSHHNHSHHGQGGTSCQHPSISTNLETLTSAPLVLGGSRLEQDDERQQQASRTLPGPDRRIRYISDTTLNALAEEQQRKQHYQPQQTQEEIDMELDMGEEGMVKLEGGADESDSILGVELGHLSPIPFSELPSMTSIGLCSRGIVRLSSNIKLLASATCVQMYVLPSGFFFFIFCVLVLFVSVFFACGWPVYISALRFLWFGAIVYCRISMAL
jgi:hypothetical protein